MTVSAEHTRSLEVEGSAAAVQAMFAMHLQTVRNVSSGHERDIAVEGHATAPAVFAAVGAHVVGFEPHVNNRIHSRIVNTASLPAARLNDPTATQGYFADDMKAAYSFPSFPDLFAGHGPGGLRADRRPWHQHRHPDVVDRSEQRSGAAVQQHHDAKQRRNADPELLAEFRPARADLHDPRSVRRLGAIRQQRRFPKPRSTHRCRWARRRARPSSSTTFPI